MVTTPQQADREMQRIARETSEPDGVWYFNHIYLLSRNNVHRHIDMGFFQDPGYINELDVEFVNLWLSAYDISKTEPHNIPVSWRPLFEHRHNSRKIAIQFMIAGLIAHIFRDLTLAVYQTETFRRAPFNKLFLTARWRDYRKVSDVIVETMNEEVLPQYRDTYSGDILLGIDSLLAGVSIRGARLDAWDRGNTMRLLHPVGGFVNSVQDGLYSVEAAALAEGFLTPNLADLLPLGE